MPASIVAMLYVYHPDGMRDYVARDPESIARAGGRIALRGHVTSILEGDIRPSRVAVIEFDTSEELHAWWNSAEAQELLQIRSVASTAWSVVVE